MLAAGGAALPPSTAGVPAVIDPFLEYPGGAPRQVSRARATDEGVDALQAFISTDLGEEAEAAADAAREARGLAADVLRLQLEEGGKGGGSSEEIPSSSPATAAAAAAAAEAGAFPYKPVPRASKL